MYYIGIDIGGTKCATILAKYSNGSFEFVEKNKFATPPSPDTALDCFMSDIDDFLEKNHLVYSDIKAIGISCGGPLDSRKGVILSPPNLKGWDNIEIVRFFTEKTGIKTILENDANACAVAEWKLGAGKGHENVIFLTFGTGMGAGIIINNKLYIGACGYAGEVGHIRLADTGPVGFGKHGSFEGFCSGGGIARLGQSMAVQAINSGKSPLFCKSKDLLESVTAKSIADAARLGDETAIEVFRISGEKLGYALSLLVDILNPSLIIIGSIYARSGELLREACEEVMKRECISASLEACKVVPSMLGDSVGDYAALSLAIMAQD